MDHSISLATIAFNKPWCIQSQITLLQRFLMDDFVLHVFDNSSDEDAANEIENICDEMGTNYIRLWLPVREHYMALNVAAKAFPHSAYCGFLDHDVWPCEDVSVSELINTIGFYGRGQRHLATGHRYLWPGLAFFSEKWLNGRTLDFYGIRGVHKRDDGDTGSIMWPLFTEEDWAKFDLFPLPVSYVQLLDPEGKEHTQEWAYERHGSWIHMSNASRWLASEFSDEREARMREVLAAL